MIGRCFFYSLALSAAAAAGVHTSAAPIAVEPLAHLDAPPAVTPAESRIVELHAYRRSGVVSAWLANGVRVHFRRMEVQPGQVEVMISFAGGELLECGETRGLSLLCASYLDRPATQDLAAADIAARLNAAELSLEGGVMSDALMIRIHGSAANVRTGLALAAKALTAPLVSPDLLEVARTASCASIERTQADAKWAVTEPLLELVTPIGDCRNKLACTKRMAAFTPEQVAGWITRHALTRPCEVAIVGDVEMNPALQLAAEIFGDLPDRPRASPAVLAQNRCVGKQEGPFARDVGCKGQAKIQDTHVLAGFLSPDPSEVQEVRRLRAGARVLAHRLEDRLRELKLGGDPHVSWTYMPSPFAGRSVTVVAARVAPGDAEPVKQLMQASMCELMDHGLPAAELARSTELLARVASAYERDPRYWAAILSRSASGGLDPEQIADGPEVYRAMKPEEVLAAMRRACTIENRLDLMVRPAP
jgi:predicted Zn-dependent peptidase